VVASYLSSELKTKLLSSGR